jgi:hypothetical protein
MHDIEEENLTDNDFEIEFSDLPMDDDEMRSISGKLTVQRLWLWTKLHAIFFKVSTRHLLLSSHMRTWLLADVSKNKLVQHDATGDFELEMSDLPSDEANDRQSMARSFGTWTHFPKKRLWRLVLVGCTLLLICSFILQSFSPLRTMISSLFMAPTPMPTPLVEGGSVDSFGRISVWRQDGTSQGSFIKVNNNVLGPAPQGARCPVRPQVDESQEVGYAPVWVGDFNGPYATMYLLPEPVPVEVFPNGYGWMVTLSLKVQSNYKGPVMLVGWGLGDGIPLLFAHDPFDNPTVSFPLDTRYPAVSPIHIDGNKLRDAWNVIMFLPAAGCYSLHAAWHGGDWQVNFAAGS